MNKKTIKIIAIIIACLLVLAVVAPALSIFVFAVQSDETLKNMEKDESDAVEELKELEGKINELGDKIYQNNERIKEIDEELTDIEDELEDAEEKEGKQMDEFKSRIAATCENSGVSYLELIFSSSSISDFVDKLVIAKELAEYDKSVIDSMKEIKSGIEDKKKSREELKEEQEKAREDNETASEELETKKRDLEEFLSDLKEDKDEYKKYLDGIDSEEEAAKEKAGIDVSDDNVDLSKVPVGSLKWPTSSNNITDEFSPDRVHPVTGEVRPHKGVDIGGNQGDPVYAAEDGTVVFSDINGGYGNCIILNHGNGVNTIYGHMSTLLVENGAKVRKGEQIGRVGSTGVSTGPHLHFEVLINGIAVDPMQFF